MTEYIYTGPLSGVTLRGVGEIMLIPGAAVSLPADNDYTRRLIKRGWLTENAPAPKGSRKGGTAIVS